MTSVVEGISPTLRANNTREGWGTRICVDGCESAGPSASLPLVASVGMTSVVEGIAPTSDAEDFDSQFLEGGDHLLGGSGVCDELLDGGGFADAPVGDGTELGVIDDGDVAAGVAEHGRVQLGFVGAEAAQAGLSVNAVGSNEHGVDEHVFKGAAAGGADEREPVSAQMTSGDEDVYVFALG